MYPFLYEAIIFGTVHQFRGTSRKKRKLYSIIDYYYAWILLRLDWDRYYLAPMKYCLRLAYTLTCLLGAEQALQPKLSLHHSASSFNLSVSHITCKIIFQKKKGGGGGGFSNDVCSVTKRVACPLDISPALVRT